MTHILEKVRRQGYATHDGEWGEQSKIAAIAMPVRHRNKVLASINMVFLKKAMTVTEGASRLLPHLQFAVNAIEKSLDELEIVRDHTQRSNELA